MASHKDKVKYKTQHVGHLQTELTKYQQRLEKLYESHLDGDIDQEFYQRKVVEYKATRDSIKNKLNATDKAEDSFYFTVDSLIRLAQKAPELLQCSEVEHRRRLINLVLQNLTLKDRQLRWEYKKPFDILARTAKTQNWLGKGSLFQTFDDLDSIIDKETEIKEIRQVLDENIADQWED
jgi:hypothetical protein